MTKIEIINMKCMVPSCMVDELPTIKFVNDLDLNNGKLDTFYMDTNRCKELDNPKKISLIVVTNQCHE